MHSGLREAETLTPKSTLLSALGKGQPKDEVAEPRKTARSEFKGVSCPKGKAACLG